MNRNGWQGGQDMMEVKSISGSDEAARVEVREAMERAAEGEPLFRPFEGNEEAGNMLEGEDMGTHRRHYFRPRDPGKSRLGHLISEARRLAAAEAEFNLVFDEACDALEAAGTVCIMDALSDLKGVTKTDDGRKGPGPLALPPRSWEQKHDFEVLFRDSPDYFAVKNAKVVLTAEGWAIFYVFKGDAFAHTEMYPSANIHRLKALKVS